VTKIKPQGNPACCHEEFSKENLQLKRDMQPQSIRPSKGKGPAKKNNRLHKFRLGYLNACRPGPKDRYHHFFPGFNSETELSKYTRL